MEPKDTTNNINEGQSDLLCGPRPAAIGGKGRHGHDADLARVMEQQTPAEGWHGAVMMTGPKNTHQPAWAKKAGTPITEAHQIVIATVEGSKGRVRLATAPLAYVGGDPRLQ